MGPSLLLPLLLPTEESMLDPTILPLPTPTSTLPPSPTLMSRSPLSPTCTLRSPLSPTSMSRSPLSPTSTRSPFPLLLSLPPLLPTTLPPLPTPDTPSLPLPSLELTPLAFPTTVNSTLFNPFSRPETPFPPKSVPQRMQQHSTA